MKSTANALVVVLAAVCLAPVSNAQSAKSVELGLSELLPMDAELTRSLNRLTAISGTVEEREYVWLDIVSSSVERVQATIDPVKDLAFVYSMMKDQRDAAIVQAVLVSRCSNLASTARSAIGNADKALGGATSQVLVQEIMRARKVFDSVGQSRLCRSVLAESPSR